MMKLFFTCLLATAPVFALLPPLNQSIAELKTIVESQDLNQLPSSEKILSIEAVEKGYLIRTQNNTLLVEVVYEAQKMPGPAPFELTFHKPTPNTQ